ncbi:hypothetical protein GEMRC1_007063 [Eukaryota sp. GEM-RC1]
MIDSIISLFRFLQAKDVFETSFKVFLSNRLLKGHSTNFDVEKLFLSKLRMEIGQTIFPMESMVKDIEISRSLLSEWNPVDLIPSTTVLCLTQGKWPFGVQSYSPIIPHVLSQSFELYSNWYRSKYKGRRLVLHSSKSTVELNFEKDSTVYSILCSLHQALVLLSFNGIGQIQSLAEIISVTGLTQEELVEILKILCRDSKYRLLLRRPRDKENSKNWTIYDEFTVNRNFSSKTIRVVLRQELPSTIETENLNISTQVSRDRTQMIDACIVRLMKMNQRLTHRDLIGKVVNDLKVHFIPNVTVIKGRIDSLIEREFIDRDDRDRELYRYVS